MSRYYGPPPPSESMAAALWGATPADICPPVAVWPDNWPILDVFVKCNTQWRTGFNGAYGLDYSVLPWLFEMCEVTDHKRAFRDIRLMEGAALDAMAEQRDASG